MVDVRVGIVSWNTADLLDKCLRSVPAALDGLDAEVVVVDNASSDGSADTADMHCGVRVIRNTENVGYARAMNQALRGTDAPVLIALNPDTDPPPGSLATLVARLEERPSVGIVAPRLVHPDGRLQHSVYRFPSTAVAAIVCFVPLRLQRGRIGREWWLEGGAPHDRSGDIDWAIGAVHVIRSEAVAATAPYSERWFMYVEDLELCWRLRQAGWTVRLEADVTVPHIGNAAGVQAWGDGRTRRYWEATYDFVRETHGPVVKRNLAIVNTVGAAFRAATLRASSLIPGRTRAARRAQHRALARTLARTVPVHAEAVVRHRTPVD